MCLYPGRLTKPHYGKTFPKLDENMNHFSLPNTGKTLGSCASVRTRGSALFFQTQKGESNNQTTLVHYQECQVYNTDWYIQLRNVTHFLGGSSSS